MAKILEGKPVSEKIGKEIEEKVKVLKEKGISPTLSTVLVGKSADALSYRKMIEKKGEKFGIKIINKEYPENIPQEEIEEEIKLLNKKREIHGILIFQPLPKSLDVNKIKLLINPEKDIDGISPINVSKVFSGESEGIPPATSQAVMELLEFYGISLEGKNAIVIGRSLVVGRPLAMLLLHKNATVTITHSKTRNLKDITRRADIVVAAIGKKEVITGEYFSPGQVVIDVGINVENGKLYGDVLFSEAEGIVDAITPVPGGVGGVTSTVLFKHLLKNIS